jgi:Lon protease-like protein
MAMNIPKIALPDVLPVFPLTGVMLLPGTVLPLHIFEPRYRAMVEDALETNRIFGMIQPYVPQDDNRGPPPGAENLAPDLYKVGCAGYIENWKKLPDGRFFIELTGVNRFRLIEELESRHGYRCVKAAYREFSDATFEQGWSCDRRRILEALATYGKAHGMEVKIEQAEKFSDLELINLLAVSLPFHPAEKQALLEAPGVTDREEMLVNLLHLGAGSFEPNDETSEYKLN